MRRPVRPPKRLWLCVLLLTLLVMLLPTGATSFAASVRPLLSVGSISVVEGSQQYRTVISVPVTLSAPSAQAIEVHYTLRGLGLAEGVDYSTSGGMVRFTPSAQRRGHTPVEQFIRIPLLSQSTMPGGKKSIAVRLHDPSGAAIGDGAGMAKIVTTVAAGNGSNSTVAYFDIGSAAIYQGRSGAGREMYLPVTLSAPVRRTATVKYEISGSRLNSALSPLDYTAPSGTLTFAAGQVYGSIGIRVNPNGAGTAPAKFLLVQLKDPVNAAIHHGRGYVVLMNRGAGVAAPLSRSYRSATLSADRKSYANQYDTFAVASPSPLQVNISAPRTNLHGDSRLVVWPTGQAPFREQQVCATWASQSPAMGQIQEGIALRISEAGGVTRAITITKNVFGDVNWLFDVHTWNTATPGVFTLLGQYDLSRALVANGRLAPFPWHICARVIERNLAFKVWPNGQAQPPWGSTTHGGAITLPRGWGYPGNAGIYIGHLKPGNSAAYSSIAVTAAK